MTWEGVPSIRVALSDCPGTGGSAGAGSGDYCDTPARMATILKHPAQASERGSRSRSRSSSRSLVRSRYLRDGVFVFCCSVSLGYFLRSSCSAQKGGRVVRRLPFFLFLFSRVVASSCCGFSLPVRVWAYCCIRCFFPALRLIDARQRVQFF